MLGISKLNVKDTNQIEVSAKRIQLIIFKLRKFILKNSDLYKSQLNSYRDEKIQLEKRVWELENDLDAEQFKRDKAELRIDQIKREMSFKGKFYRIFPIF